MTNSPDPPETLIKVWTDLLAEVARGHMTAKEATKIYNKAQALYKERNEWQR